MASTQAAIVSSRQILRSFPALILALCIVFLLSYEILRSYLQAREDAERRVSNLVHLMSEQITRTIQTVDINLQDISDELEEKPGLPENDPEFRARLQRLAIVPFVRAIAVVGPDGNVLHNSEYPKASTRNIADRAYFKAHRDDPSLGLHISGPLKSQSRGVSFFSLSRRIHTVDGHFAGIIVAAVEPLYYESLYKRLWLGKGAAALLLEEGTMLARSSTLEQVFGESFGYSETFRSLLMRKDLNVAWVDSPIDGAERLIGYKRVAGAPIVSIITLGSADLMRTWRSHAIVGVIGASILLALLLLLECLSIRNRRREQTARQRLEKTQRMEAIGRFASSIAHDCGNIMRIIRSATLVLKPLVSDRQDAVRLINEVELSLDSGRSLIHRLLSYARNAEDRFEIASPQALVEDVLPIAQQAAGPGVDVVVTSTGQSGHCRLDKAQFQAAIINVILNARDAMPLGGKITIDVRSIQDRASTGTRHWIDINIQDNGTGMDEDIQRQALDPFFTMKDAGMGHGMGLSQVQDFAHRSGGRIDVFSQPDCGTTVRIRLPSETDVGRPEGAEAMQRGV